MFFNDYFAFSDIWIILASECTYIYKQRDQTWKIF